MMSETIEQTIEHEQKSSDERRRQVEAAAAQVAELEREQQEATARLSDPATVFDAALAVELRQRLDELPLFLNAARLKHASLRVEMYDLEAAEHKARLPELYEAMVAEQTRYDAAREVYQTAVQAWRGARVDSRVSSTDANEARELVSRLQAEASNIGGAVVRRRP
jgi:DNA repair exonuclease SbcCD ATPase subunit